MPRLRPLLSVYTGGTSVSETPQQHFDRWFNAVTGCLLNIVLAGLILVSYSA